MNHTILKEYTCGNQTFISVQCGNCNKTFSTFECHKSIDINCPICQELMPVGESR